MSCSDYLVYCRLLHSRFRLNLYGENSVIGIDDNALQRLTDCLGLPLVDLGKCEGNLT